MKIKLLGEIGRKFIREVELGVTTARDVVRALEANFPGFRQYLVDKNFHVLKIRGKEVFSLGEDDLDNPLNSESFLVMPATGIGGSGGIFRVIAGAALIGLSFAVPFLNPIGIAMGASLVAGGISQLLSPQPRTPQGEREKEDSYLYNASSQRDITSLPVPLLYGRFTVTSPVIISQSITTDQLL